MAVTIQKDNPLLQSSDQTKQGCIQGAYLMATIMKKEIRCGHCNRLLAKGEARELEIKCRRCGTMNYVRTVCLDREAPEAHSEKSVETTW
ncbi:Com family DNA-binding transcriptional regulator [Oleidesulfovibrio sp.]|uniref:Com family DNA-binding transcriptional regulator n=1 Tax=Oleidesulfovibrio sp. TaxID=2909707 RepID=UPI003A8A46AF